MKLKCEGNVIYNEWTLKCQCKANPEFDCKAELQRLASVMEQGLQNWRQEVKRARDTYYALNYYTNAQLLVLRENLSKQPCPVTVLDLLQSISPSVTGRDVSCCLQNDMSINDGLNDSGHGSVDFDHPVVERKKGYGYDIYHGNNIQIINILDIRFTISVRQEKSLYLTLQKLGDVLQSLCLRLPGYIVDGLVYINILHTIYYT